MAAAVQYQPPSIGGHMHREVGPTDGVRAEDADAVFGFLNRLREEIGGTEYDVMAEHWRQVGELMKSGTTDEKAYLDESLRQLYSDVYDDPDFVKEDELGETLDYETDRQRFENSSDLPGKVQRIAEEFVMKKGQLQQLNKKHHDFIRQMSRAQLRAWIENARESSALTDPSEAKRRDRRQSLTVGENGSKVSTNDTASVSADLDTKAIDKKKRQQANMRGGDASDSAGSSRAVSAAAPNSSLDVTQESKPQAKRILPSQPKLQSALKGGRARKRQEDAEEKARRDAEALTMELPDTGNGSKDGDGSEHPDTQSPTKSDAEVSGISSDGREDLQVATKTGSAEESERKNRGMEQQDKSREVRKKGDQSRQESDATDPSKEVDAQSESNEPTATEDEAPGPRRTVTDVNSNDRERMETMARENEEVRRQWKAGARKRMQALKAYRSGIPESETGSTDPSTSGDDDTRQPHKRMKLSDDFVADQETAESSIATSLDPPPSGGIDETLPEGRHHDDQYWSRDAESSNTDQKVEGPSITDSEDEDVEEIKRDFEPGTGGTEPHNSDDKRKSVQLDSSTGEGKRDFQTYNTTYNSRDQLFRDLDAHRKYPGSATDSRIDAYQKTIAESFDPTSNQIAARKRAMSKHGKKTSSDLKAEAELSSISDLGKCEITKKGMVGASGKWQMHLSRTNFANGGMSYWKSITTEGIPEVTEEERPEFDKLVKEIMQLEGHLKIDASRMIEAPPKSKQSTGASEENPSRAQDDLTSATSTSRKDDESEKSDQSKKTSRRDEPEVASEIDDESWVRVSLDEQPGFSDASESESDTE